MTISPQQRRLEADQLESMMVTGNDFDRKIIRGVPGSYGGTELKDKRVLDLGAQIGSFSVYAAWKGAKEIRSVEPLPRNIELLKENTKKYSNIKVYEAAVVKDTSYPRFLTSGAVITNHEGSNFGHNILRTKIGNVNVASYSVPLVSFEELLDFNPQVIKMDIEGSEHELLEGYTATSEVEALLLEIHFFDYMVVAGWASRLKNLLDQGFRIIRGKDSIINGTGQYGILTLLRN